MKAQSLLVIFLLPSLALVSTGHAQATSVKRITRQLPPGAVPSQPPPVPAPVPVPTSAAKTNMAPATVAARTGAPVPPPVPVRTKTDAEKAELLKKTIESERRRAEAGSDSAQYDVGMRYFRGDGMEKNLEEAAKWLEKSAKQGNETAGKRLDDVKALLKH